LTPSLLRLVLALPLLSAVAPGTGLRAAAEPGAQAPARPETDEERSRRESDLKSVQDALAASAEARRRLDAEIAEIRTDRAKLSAALVDTAAKVRATEERIGALEQRLQTLSASEGAIRVSLNARRAVIGEVLAALQRMGRRPPPAVLVRPEDMLAAVRTSMLLGAVIPELRGEVETLAGDLGELVRLKQAIVTDREVLGKELAALGDDQRRLDALVGARQAKLAAAETAAGGEAEKAAQLAGQARSLKELIDRMEREVSAGRRAAEDARKAGEAQSRDTRERFASLAFRDPARLAPKVPFVEARGVLPRPVSGEQVRDFGAPDGLGGTTRGVSFTTRPRALVTSPADGWVAFAGPFRSFGRLLIVNAGGGYYLLLAGMDHINVEVGQFVLAGEPVATMGESSSVSPAVGAIETSGPVLYVEFRKDGGSIDPGPWWSKSQGEKVRG
jgi:murein hydrolase activator